MQEFIEQYNKSDKLKQFDLIHDQLVDYINKDEVESVNKLIDFLLINQNRGTLRTILMTLKPVNQKYTEQFNKVLSVFNEK